MQALFIAGLQGSGPIQEYFGQFTAPRPRLGRTVDVHRGGKGREQISGLELRRKP